MKEEKVLKKYSRLNIEEKAPRIVKHKFLDYTNMQKLLVL